MNIKNSRNSLGLKGLSIVAIVGTLAFFTNGCASRAVQHDVYSFDPHTGQTHRDLSYDGGVRSVGGVYQKELVRTDIYRTNTDGTVFQDHSASYEKGFHFPSFGLGGLFRIVINTGDIPCIPQVPQCYAPRVYYQMPSASYYVTPTPMQYQGRQPCRPQSYYPSPGY
jgi:hypothetical protein